MIETLRQVTLPIHITCGAVVLLLGLIQMCLPKAGSRHRIIGRLYFWLMVVIFFTSFPISIATDNYFLASVGVFALYLVWTGRRLAANKNDSTQKIDRWITYGAFVASMSLMVLSVLFFIRGAGGFSIVPFVFGTIMFLGVVQDYHFYVKGKTEKRFGKMRWYFVHLTRMIGSYIAATTAFLVNAQPLGSHWLNWLVPTIMGSVVIIGFSRYYKRKFNLQN